jgi:hypothetical protein
MWPKAGKWQIIEFGGLFPNPVTATASPLHGIPCNPLKMNGSVGDRISYRVIH